MAHHDAASTVFSGESAVGGEAAHFMGEPRGNLLVFSFQYDCKCWCTGSDVDHMLAGGGDA